MKAISIQIPPTLLTRIRNSEHMGLLTDIDTIIQAKLKDIQGLVPIYNNFHSVYRQEDDIFKRDAMAVETKFVTNAHLTRRDSFRAVKLSIDTGALSVDEKAKEAATILKEVLHNYRTVTKVSMYEATALIRNMIEDLRKPRYEGAVKVLGLEDAVERLDEDNEAFRTIYLERSHNREELDIQGTMKEIRPKADKVLKDMVGGINAFYLSTRLSGVEDEKNPYKDVIVSIDGIVDQVKLNFEHRNPGAYKDKDNGGDEDEEPEVVTPGPPALAISAQTIESATRMLLVAEDQKAFDDALYPEAEGGILKLEADDYNDYSNFPIESFDVQSGKVTGIVVSPPQDGMVFRQPIYVMSTQVRARILKDDETLATLTGVVWPESFWD